MPRDIGDLHELPGLLEAILAGNRVDDKQRFVRRASHFAAGDAFHFFELGHQVRFVVQAAGRVDDQNVRSYGLVRL